ncbi:MAG: FAD-dependent oxidoreductase [Pseudomonadota bacterium]
MNAWDVMVIGAGTAGMPLAIEAVARGANVLVVEQAARVGGTLHVSLGQMSGAGTRLQSDRGIVDSADDHLADIARINRGTGRADLLARTVPRQGETIDWLMDNGFDMAPECPAILHLHEAYRTARTYWGREGGLSVLKAITPLFEAAMASPRAQLRLGTRAEALIKGAGGEVVGARLRNLATGTTEEVRANHVVLASGGYGASPSLFARFTGGHRLVTAAPETSTGTGLEMAEAIGGRLVGAHKFLPTYAAVAPPDGTAHVAWRQVPSLTPQVRLPYEVHLDRNGRRFVREDHDSVDARENALNALPDLSFWCVFDTRVELSAPPLLPGWTARELAEAWRTHPSFVAADGLEALATATGMAQGALTDSLAAYNSAIATGKPDPMGRTHRPLAIEGPSYRAILMHGMVLKTPAGLDVDDDLVVRGEDGHPIKGLYAVGEAMGGAALSGKGFVSGMSVTPALTLGRWLGGRLGEAARQRAQEVAQ